MIENSSEATNLKNAYKNDRLLELELIFSRKRFKRFFLYKRLALIRELLSEYVEFML